MKQLVFAFLMSFSLSAVASSEVSASDTEGAAKTQKIQTEGETQSDKAAQDATKKEKAKSKKKKRSRRDCGKRTGSRMKRC